VIGDFGQLIGLTGEQWAWALATSVLLFGYVTTWYAALQRAPATAVTCVLVLGAPITAALDAIAGHGLPDAEQLAGYAVLVLAVAAIAVLARAGAEQRTAPQLRAVAS
jgi:drug/metabolite transporter (DMT)-like permease